MKILIQSNKMQEIASKVSAASFVKYGVNSNDIKFLNFDDNNFIKPFIGKKYLRNGKIKLFKNDLQSFTLLRFFGPQFLKYQDKALIIDPDVFALKDPSEIINYLKENESIACTFYNGKPRSEVMLVNCNKINWNFEKILSDLFNFKVDYSELMNLSFDRALNIKELDKNFNTHDKINPNTVLLHTTNRLTQPWKEGINIDFEWHISKKYKFKQVIKKLFGLNYNKKILEKTYQRHPEKKVIEKFKELFYFAKEINFINDKEIDMSIKNNFFSTKFLEN